MLSLGSNQKHGQNSTVRPCHLTRLCSVQQCEHSTTGFGTRRKTSEQIEKNLNGDNDDVSTQNPRRATSTTRCCCRNRSSSPAAQRPAAQLNRSQPADGQRYCECCINPDDLKVRSVCLCLVRRLRSAERFRLHPACVLRADGPVPAVSPRCVPFWRVSVAGGEACAADPRNWCLDVVVQRKPRKE